MELPKGAGRAKPKSYTEKQIERNKYLRHPTEEEYQKHKLREHFVLTKTEAEVAFVLLTSQSRKEIAEKLFVSEATVKFHLNSIYRKTGRKNMFELAQILHDLGFGKRDHFNVGGAIPTPWTMLNANDGGYRLDGLPIIDCNFAQKYSISNVQQVNYCVPASLASALEMLVGERNFEASEMFLGYIAREQMAMDTKDARWIQTNMGCGTYVALKAFEKWGVCRKHFCQDPQDINRKPHQGAYNDAEKNKTFIKIKKTSIPHDVRIVQQAVSTGNPVLFTIPFYPSTFKFPGGVGDPVARLRLPMAGEKQSGSHAMVLNGLDRNRECFLAKNHNGPAMGRFGQVEVPFAMKNFSDIWMLEKAG